MKNHDYSLMPPQPLLEIQKEFGRISPKKNQWPGERADDMIRLIEQMHILVLGMNETNPELAQQIAGHVIDFLASADKAQQVINQNFYPHGDRNISNIRGEKVVKKVKEIENELTRFITKPAN